MAFEYYTRSGTKMLRCGYTTGTCAALAAAAATRILLTGKAPESVCLMTGKGIPVEVEVEHWGMEPVGDPSGDPSSEPRPASAWAAIPKDAGDDADVTDGLLIRADVTWADVGADHAGQHLDTGAEQQTVAGAALQPSRRAVLIDGGRGVGRVTKPGLDQPVGNAAINSGPRRMIEEAVRKVCAELGHRLPDDAAPEKPDSAAPEQPAAPARGLRVIISVPEGESAAKKTFNANLGIEGGISILGTTGIVEPMSEQALVDTIEVELKQIAVDSRNLILTPGNYGSDFIEGYGLNNLGIPVLKFSNFLGETLDMIASTQIDNVLLVAHAGKLSKVAAGIMNTHSKYADGRNEIFCAHAAICGADTELCRELMEAATTDACIDILDKADDLRGKVMESILQAIQQKLEHRCGGRYRIGAMMFSNVYGLLGMTGPAEEILTAWEERKL